MVFFLKKKNPDFWALWIGTFLFAEMTIIGREGVEESGGRIEKIVRHRRPGPHSEDPTQMYCIAKEPMHRNFFN